MYSPNRFTVRLRAVLLGDERRAGEGDARRVGEGLEQVVAEIRALRAVRLVDHQQNALGRVHDAEGLGADGGLP